MGYWEQIGAERRRCKAAQLDASARARAVVRAVLLIFASASLWALVGIALLLP